MGKKRFITIAVVLGLLLVVIGVLLVIGTGDDKSSQETQEEVVDDGPDSLFDDDHEPVYPGGDIEPTYHRRPATAEERAEDLEEIRRMHAELPGNYWLPPIPGQENTGPTEEQQKAFSENERLRRKVRNGKASAEEKASYLAFRRKITEDRIAVIEYYMRRAEESPGQKWFSKDDIAAGNDRIEELRARLAKLEAELR